MREPAPPPLAPPGAPGPAPTPSPPTGHAPPGVSPLPAPTPPPTTTPPSAGGATDAARGIVEGGTVAAALRQAGVTTPEQAQTVLDYGREVTGLDDNGVANLLRRASTTPGGRDVLNSLVRGAGKDANGDKAGALADVAGGVSRGFTDLRPADRSALVNGVLGGLAGTGLAPVGESLGRLTALRPDAGRGAMNLVEGALRGDGAAVQAGLVSMESAIRRGAVGGRVTSEQELRAFDDVRQSMLETLPADQQRRVLTDMTRKPVTVGEVPTEYLGRRMTLDQVADSQLKPSIPDLADAALRTSDRSRFFLDLDTRGLSDAFAAVAPGQLGVTSAAAYFGFGG